MSKANSSREGWISCEEKKKNNLELSDLMVVYMHLSMVYNKKVLHKMAVANHIIQEAWKQLIS